MVLGRPFPKGDEPFEALACVFEEVFGKTSDDWRLGEGACFEDCIIQASRKDEYWKKDVRMC